MKEQRFEKVVEYKLTEVEESFVEWMQSLLLLLLFFAIGFGVGVLHFDLRILIGIIIVFLFMLGLIAMAIVYLDNRKVYWRKI